MANHLKALIIGQQYGRLTPLRRVDNSLHAARWLCRCVCGSEQIYDGFRVYSGHTKSCGCLHADSVAAFNQSKITHGHTIGRHNNSRPRSRTYISYHSMLSRCHHPQDPHFYRYGGIGISVTKAWRDDFANFLNDMGQRPIGMSIDRIDNRFGYFMANCRWATWKQQRANQRKRGRMSQC